MKLIMQTSALAFILAFAVSLPTGALAQVSTAPLAPPAGAPTQTETEAEERLSMCKWLSEAYNSCDGKCRFEYERCLRQAANIDANPCRGEYDNCNRICEKAYCEE